MWLACLLLSILCLTLSALLSIAINRFSIVKKQKFNLFNALFAGVFIAALFIFFPVHRVMTAEGFLGVWHAFLLSAFNSMQIFAMGCEFAVVTESMMHCPDWLNFIYQTWTAVLFVLAPIFTFGFVLSLFKNLSAYLGYFSVFFKDTYVFSELNDKSLVLAGDIKKNHPRAAIVFTDVFDNNEECSYELIESAKQLGAVCFKRDILAIDFNVHSPKKFISFFAIGCDEGENLNQSLKLIQAYKNRKGTNVYIFSTKVESELVLTSVDKGEVRVRRINEVQSLVNRVLYERGEIIFESACPRDDGIKDISAVVVGMGSHGTEMVKALTWFGQMDGYRLEINAFDKDPLAEEKFIALAPELMSDKYNGVTVEGEAQYKIAVHSDLDVQSVSFARAIEKIGNATYVFISLGNDNVNISTAINLRMYFERMKIHPVIQAVVYNSSLKEALVGVKNYRGQKYDIEFIGDTESSFTEDVIIDSELEEDALSRHLKWGNEEEFWTYEYNYRSSTASAIHLLARKKCGIPGAYKQESELTEHERGIIETLEHRRWNAYMRAEGYVYSGAHDKATRNDLGKMHHDLVDFETLTEEEKRVDSRVGTE